MSTKLIQDSEIERFVGGFGVSVTNGSRAGGEIRGINESDEEITVSFVPFITQIPNNYSFHMYYDMRFYKRSLQVKRIEGCLVIAEGTESCLVLYPNTRVVIEAFRK